MINTITVIITRVALGVALILALFRLFKKLKWLEPAITALVLLSAITGLIAEPWLQQKEKRHELLYSLAHELYFNANILDDKLFKPDSELIAVYPRLQIGVANAALSSGAFVTRKDRELFKRLYDWTESANDFNIRLGVTEQKIFGTGSPAIAADFKQKLTSGRVMQGIREKLRQLMELLMTQYSSESEIRENTVLFQ